MCANDLPRSLRELKRRGASRSVIIASPTPYVHELAHATFLKDSHVATVSLQRHCDYYA